MAAFSYLIHNWREDRNYSSIQIQNATIVFGGVLSNPIDMFQLQSVVNQKLPENLPPSILTDYQLNVLGFWIVN